MVIAVALYQKQIALTHLDTNRMSSKPNLIHPSVDRSATPDIPLGRRKGQLNSSLVNPRTRTEVSGKCLPRLHHQENVAKEVIERRTADPRRVAMVRRAYEDLSFHGAARSTVVELPGIDKPRRHSVAGTTSSAVAAIDINTDYSDIEVIRSPLRRRRSSSDAVRVANSSFRTRDRREKQSVHCQVCPAPIPPSSLRLADNTSKLNKNNNRSYNNHCSTTNTTTTTTTTTTSSTTTSSKHFELTLQKIDEKKIQENVFPLTGRSNLGRKAERNNAVALIDRQYLGGEDYHEFRSSVEGRLYANISDMPSEYAKEFLSQQEDDIGLPDEHEDEHLRQKCLDWLETLP